MPRFLLRARPILLAFCCILAVTVADPNAFAQPPGGKGFKGKGGGTKPGEMKKFDEVITKDAKTTSGVFTVHRLDDKVFFEIPKEALGKLMLWTIEVARGPAGVSWGGKSLGNKVVRWERRGGRVYLWDAGFTKRGDGRAVQRAVDSANMDTILLSFAVEAEGKDRSAVLDVTSMFTSDVPDFSVKGAVTGASGIDDSRSYVESVKSFPTNLEVRSLLTFRTGGMGGAEGKGGGKGKGGGGGGGRSYTAMLHHSFVQLPDQPMRGRFFDPRVGYFTRSFEDYAANKGWMETRQFIARFRLEKKDPTEEISEPVKPIVFYLSREIPEKWRKYLKQGVEDWQPAFEKAGFKNAILCKEAPSEREDPDWDSEDARHSVIRWVAEPTQNAMGPNVHDPRSGEIISAHIIFWHDIVKLVQMWYFVQCGGSDPRVTQLPLSDEIIGECLRYVSCHEVGHTLGLRHNHRASQAYSIEQLRDPAFTDKHGTVASIMSYGRFNYVAQPGDKVKSYLPKLAPYDLFAIEWGYKGIPTAKTADEERRTLNEWASRQVTNPALRFGGEDGPSTVDPTVLTENIGSDAIEATRLGLLNLDRVIDKLIPATSRSGEDFSLLQDAYKAVIQHRGLWFGAVAKQIGGVRENRVLGGGKEEPFSRLTAEEQKRAVQFVLENAFRTPKKLLDPALVNRFKYVGVAEEVMNQQRTLLRSLLSGRRFRQLQDAEVVGQTFYSALEFFGDVQDGVWSELRQPEPNVDAVRRSLHRAYLEHLKSELNPKEPTEAAAPAFPGRRGGGEEVATKAKDSDFRAVAREGLRKLAGRIEVLLKTNKDGNNRPMDAMTRAHLEDCLREIRAILNPPKE